MRRMLGNCFEPNLFEKYVASGLPNVAVVHDASMHGCNGAYILATDSEDAELTRPLRISFSTMLQKYQRMYFGAYGMSRAA